MKGGVFFSISLSLWFAGCAPPPPPAADGAVAADAAADVADASLATRPPVYPTNPPATCRTLAFNSFTIEAPPPGCVPWVGFVHAHPMDSSKWVVAASACGRVVLLDPTMSTQPLALNMVPDGQTPTANAITPVGGRDVLSANRSLSTVMQLGSGLQLVTLDGVTAPRAYPAGMHYRLTSPNALPVSFVTGLAQMNGQPAQAAWMVVETPRIQPDGSYLVERVFVRSGLSQYNLTPVRRSVAAPQQEGITAKGFEISCAAGDGKVVVDWYANTMLYPPIQFDTGDRSIQRCSIANINGTLVGVASSETRSVAFTVQLGALPGVDPSTASPFSVQPYYLPAAMSQLGMDQGPFDVSIYGGLDLVPSGLGLYLRRQVGGAAPRPMYAMFDRQMEYDSAPGLVDFNDLEPTERELHTGAIWPTGQVAFARYNPRTGRLSASTAMCSR